jgi:hypothetical protein
MTRFLRKSVLYLETYESQCAEGQSTYIQARPALLYLIVI